MVEVERILADSLLRLAAAKHGPLLWKYVNWSIDFGQFVCRQNSADMLTLDTLSPPRVGWRLLLHVTVQMSSYMRTAMMLAIDLYRV